MNQDVPLAIQKIENLGDGNVLISVNVPEIADKGKIENDFWRGYKFAKKTLKEYYKSKLDDKNQEIKVYKSAQKALENKYQSKLDDKNREINRLFDLVSQGQKLLSEASNRIITIEHGNYNEDIKGDYSEK